MEQDLGAGGFLVGVIFLLYLAGHRKLSLSPEAEKAKPQSG